MRIRKHRTTYLLFTLILLSTAGCEGEHLRPANIYIPDGYVGWVRIEYGVEGAPKLERDFMTFFVGPKDGYEQHNQELEKFKRGDCKYVMNSLADLPKVGNLRERQ